MSGVFVQLLSPAICAACNMLGGAGVGYAYHDVGVSLNWVDRHTQVGKIDDDALMIAASWQAVHIGPVGVGPYVGCTFAPDGRGPKPITAVGVAVQLNF